MDELISDRTKYIALALLGLASIGGAVLFADGPPVESLPAEVAPAAKPKAVVQLAPDMAAEPESEASPAPSAAPSAAASGQASAEQGDAAAQDDGWAKSE
ncbi:MAG: hypothetical protein K2W91_06335 [Novosphingobium sp.]|nr:hypothetical protein [Novosphingobium sp.]